MNRLGVFVFYDAEGIVDEFIPFLLEDITRELSRLIIICNGTVNEEGKRVLSKYSDEIIIRPNEDYDGGAYKYVLTEYVGRGECSKYDELLLLNDTFCGPFYTFSTIFKTMEERDCDIWGLSMHGKCIIQDVEKNEHIQSYFINVKKKALESNTFWDFWTNMNHAKNFDEAVNNFEIAFSAAMMQGGLVLDAFLNVEKYMSSVVADNFNYSQIRCGEVCDKYAFPVFKRKNFLNQTPRNDEMRRAIEFIYNNYDYPLDYLWKPVFRKFELGALAASFGLNHPFHKCREGECIAAKALCILYSKLPDFSVDLGEAVNKLPQNVETLFLNEEPVTYLQNNANLFDEYDYIGIMRDFAFYYDGQNTNRLSRLQDRDYVFRRTLLSRGIISYLSELNSFQKSIGLIYAEQDADSYWKMLCSNEKNKELIESFLSRQGMVFRNTEPNVPVFGQESFWCQSSLLKKAMKLYSKQDCKAWYLALPYIVQNFGSGLVFFHAEENSDSLLGVAKHNAKFTFNQLQVARAQTRKAENERKNLQEALCLERIKSQAMKEQILKNQALFRMRDYLDCKLFLYGCGKVSKLYTKLLNEANISISGYIVTDNKKNDTFFMGRPVISIDNYTDCPSAVVMVAVGEALKPEILHILKDVGVRNTIVLDSQYLFYDSVLNKANGEVATNFYSVDELKVVENVSMYPSHKLYIYGCGKVSKKYSSILEKYHYSIEGYIVSDGENHEDIFLGHPVCELSSFQYDAHTVVLIGVGERLRETVINLLHNNGITNVLVVDSTALFEQTRLQNERRFELYESIMHQNFLQQLALDAAPYEYGSNHPYVKSSEELLEELIRTNKSLIRFGDGEFQLMKNQARPWFQTPNTRLAEKLNEAFYQEKKNVIVAIPDILGDLRKYRPEDQANIRYYLKDGVREELLNIVGTERTYYDAYVSRPYLMYANTKHGKGIFDLFKKLWKDKHVLLVEGEYIRSGVGNDLFEDVASLKRIICPSTNAFQYYDEIMQTISKQLEGVDLVLCALGPTATVLAYELADTGIQIIDLGQIDNEYEWCKLGVTERIPISGKAVPEIEDQHQADASKDETYLKQIVERVHC